MATGGRRFRSFVVLLAVCLTLSVSVALPTTPVTSSQSSSSSDDKLSISCLSGNCQHDTTTVTVGGKIHFRCLTAEGHDVSQKISWFHNGRNILNRPCDTNSITLQEPCIMSGAHFETLVINSLSTSDAGNFKCCYANCVSSSQDISVTVLPTLIITKPILPKKQLSPAPTTSTNTLRSTSAISTPVPLAIQSVDPTFSAPMKGTEMFTRFQSVTEGITPEPTETTMVDPERTMYFGPTKSVVDKTVIGNNKDSGGNLDGKVWVIAGTFVGGLIFVVVVIVIVCVVVFTDRCKQPPEGNSSEEPLSRLSNSDNCDTITSIEGHPQDELVSMQPSCDESRHDAPISPIQADSLVRVHHLEDMEKRIRGDISQTGNQLGKQVVDVGKQVVDVGDQVADLGDELAERGNQPRNNNNAPMVQTSSIPTETAL
ncbi:uncharacterized protein LOC134177127 isoform X2 [Corticium candelabrum]|uniref:uncharacterized protein LOC134177127 isoform X2 n=1 Tax=Corticium candelabrum TaxID=121492 RepID=UPI002E25EC08|nr:uncharacterized protein LOC134177127 isoform X2 [Corticium candelabrum]